MSEYHTPGSEHLMAEGTGLPPQLIKYWTVGEGAAKIGGWGHPGDFDACLVQIQKAVTEHGDPPLPDRVIKGLCATLHKIATGEAPGHAAGEVGHR
jgi:hypothetical protein